LRFGNTHGFTPLNAPPKNWLVKPEKNGGFHERGSIRKPAVIKKVI
jgi:hypothetical protein